MGEEKLDNAVYYIRGLYDLADMADSKGDRRTENWARRRADDLARRFEKEWWMEDQSLHADSLGENDEKIQQKHWITGTPMDAVLTVKGDTVPGLAEYRNGTDSLKLHETPCFSGTRPLNEGLFHVGVIAYAIYLAAKGTISFGDVLTFSMLFLNVMHPLREIARIMDDAHESSLQVGDLLGLLETPVDRSFSD